MRVSPRSGTSFPTADRTTLIDRADSEPGGPDRTGTDPPKIDAASKHLPRGLAAATAWQPPEGIPAAGPLLPDIDEHSFVGLAIDLAAGIALLEPLLGGRVAHAAAMSGQSDAPAQGRRGHGALTWQYP